jgi:hypothetical protein
MQRGDCSPGACTAQNPAISYRALQRAYGVPAYTNVAHPDAPSLPELKQVTVDPKTTALLMVDFLKANCGVRPRCGASLPTAKKLLGEARAAKTSVLYTFFGNFSVADMIDPELAPKGNNVDWAQRWGLRC